MIRTTALVSALLLATTSVAHAQGGPGGRIGAPGGGGSGGPVDMGGGPAGGGADGGGPAMRGLDGPSALSEPDGGGSPSRGTEGQSSGDAGAGGNTPHAARESGGDGDRGNRAERPDRGGRKAAEDAGDAATNARKSGEDAVSSAKPSTREAADKAAPSKTDQAREKDSADRKEAAGQQSGDATKEARDKAEGKEAPRADTADAVTPERAKNVQLSGEKRDRIQTAFRGKPDVKHRTRVDIDISVGRRLPRDWDFAPVPIAVIELVPEYRDYVYVWVEDDYLICDPATYEVVAVIPAGGGSRAAAGYEPGGSGKCSTRIELSANEKELILDSVRGREVDVADLQVGWSVPGDIELQRFPDEVLNEASELSACRYFVAEDQLAIVDPDEDKVVLLIDKT